MEKHYNQNKSICNVIISILILFFTNQSSIYCQSSKKAYDYVSTTASKAIIKEYNYPYTISYIETIDNKYFTYTDIDNTHVITYKTVDNNYTINDFVIRNDSIFFCGQKTSGKGIIGFFNIYDFFWGSGTYELYDDFYAQSTITSFSKIVSYISTISPVHIICIGETEQGMSCITDMHYDISSTSWKYKSGDFIDDANESFKDITLTDKYVVTAGYLTDNPKHMTIRRFKREDILSTATLKDYVNVYNGPVSNGLCCQHDNILLSTYNKDTVVTAHLWTISGSQNIVNGLYIAFHDLTNITLPANMIKAIGTTESANLNNSELNNMIIDRSSEYIYLLHRTERQANVCSMVDEIKTNLTTSNYMLVRYDTSINYSSIDFYNTTKYTINGFEMADPTKIIFTWITPHINGNCISNDLIQYKTCPLITNEYLHRPLKINSSDIVLIKLKSGQAENNKVIVECIK